jgi:nucleotide-binding universal stress UspA family protein
MAMAYKDVLVLLDRPDAVGSLLEVAFEVARDESAHFVGLCVVPPVRSMTLTGSAHETAALDLVDAKLREDGLAHAGRVETAFRERAAQLGIAAEWRCIEGPVAETASFNARYADIAVLSLAEHRPSPLGDAALVERMLLGSGRPLVVAPRNRGARSIGRKVLVAWNATREAARAVNDALPILALADHVTLLSVDPARIAGAIDTWPAADIARHLARHDVKVAGTYIVSRNQDIGDAILVHARDFDYDLIVMGGFGHWSGRELILGGATIAVLERAAIPVLMSH